MTTDLYARITDSIIAELEKGVRPWAQPWSTAHAAGSVSRPLRHNVQPYNGINVLLLWMAASVKGYAAPLWMTYKQAEALGAQVRKGEKGSPVTYADKIKKHETDEQSGEETEREVYFLKQYTVFNVEQIDGLPARYYAPPQPIVATAEERNQAAEGFFANLDADIRHGGNQAYYSPSSDHVQMPAFESFKEAEGYYSVLGHECVHWTMHPKRLAREFGKARFGNEAYAQEELVAEIGAAFIAADLGIALEPRPDHASYIASWLKVLKNDTRAIFTAAAHAQKAVEYLKVQQPSFAQEQAA